MARSTAHIFCIETPWDSDLRRRSSVRPLLEVLEERNAARFIHRDAATPEEFDFYLSKWAQKRYSEYTLGYFAFHGEPDRLQLGRHVLTLEHIQDHLAGALKGRVVYFSSCSTLGVDDGLIDEFRRVTGARAVCGFSKDVDWLEAAAFDLNFLDAMTCYSRVSYAFRHLARIHEGAVKRLGFRAVWQGDSL